MNKTRKLKKQYVSKNEFENWKNIILNKYKKDKRKYIQDKFVIFIYDNKFSNFTNITQSDIPSKTNINMFHIGKNEMDYVSYGLDKDNETIKLPATDTGGLTNVTI